MTDENVITLTIEQRLNHAQTELVKYQQMLRDEARDASIMYAMLSHFVTMCVERHDYSVIVDALDYAREDTGLDMNIIAEAVDRMGICDPALCEREYNVTVTVPVTVTVNVVATSDENAEDAARDAIDCNGLDNYYMELDVWNNAEFYVEEG